MNVNLSNSEDRINTALVLVCFIGLVAYYVGIINMYVWLFFLLIRLFTFNRKEFGFFALLFGSSMFGRMFASQSLYLSTIVLFLVLGIIALRNEIFSVLSKSFHSYFFLLILIGFFLVEYLLGPGTFYAHDKIMKLSVRGLIWLTVFLIFVQSDEISNKKIAVSFLLLTLFYLSQSALLYGIRPSAVLDFSYFRDYCDMIGRNEAYTEVVNYQTLGYLALAPSIFCMMDSDWSKNNAVMTYAIIAISFWVLLLSGTRQTLVIFLAIAFLRYILGQKGPIPYTRLIGLAIAAVLVYFMISNLGSSSYDQMINEDGDLSYSINRDTTTPFAVMDINPFFGVGFGGYVLYAHKAYPHNFFLEVIDELGIVGLLFILAVLTCFMMTNVNKVYFRFLSRNGSYIFLFFLMCFLRSMISGDMADSMSFICVLLAMTLLPEPAQDEVTELAVIEDNGHSV